MKSFPFILLLLFQFLVSKSQSSTERWSEHLSYFNCNSFDIVDNKVYCASGLGMFYFDQADESINSFNKLKGLSDIDISVLRYDATSKTLVITYQNGNIDLLNTATGDVTNLPELLQKSLNFSKKTFHIYFHQQYAYLACSFGILVVNLERKEIADTYFIGPLGSMIQINDVVIFNKRIYAASNLGLLSAEFENTNLADYRNWSKENINYLGTVETNALCVFNDRLLVNASYRNELKNDNLFEYSNSQWNLGLYSIPQIRNIRNSQNKLVITGKNKLEVYKQDGTTLLSMDKFDRGLVVLKDACYDSKGTLWFCDSLYSIGQIVDQKIERKSSNSPRYTGVSHIIGTKAGDVWVAGGGQSNQYSGYGAYRFTSGHWKTFNFETYYESLPVRNFNKTAINPRDNSHVCMASWGYGVAEFKNEKYIQAFDESNSPLTSVNNNHTSYVWISDVAFDQMGNLWISASNVYQTMFVKPYNKNQIEAFPLNFHGSYDQVVGDLLITSKDTKWLILKKTGILAFNNKKQELLFSVVDEKGTLVSNGPNCMVQDLDEAIWVGTDAGIAIYATPENALTNARFFAYRPIVNNQYLLSSEKITALAVDGANRKWIGTENSGVFLVSASGTEQIKHYTFSNSPLLSNQIVTIGINPQNGEVFIGTSRGVVSVNSDASAGNEDFEGIYTFPNPVRPNYTGDINIVGLMDGSNVKITDVTGGLVYETTSNGGTAIWNGKNLSGDKVSTGIYLIFCTNTDGSKSKVSKLLFVK